MRRGQTGRGTGGLLTILFTDIESSTAVTQRIGDAAAQEIVRAHNRIVRQEVATRGGSEIKHTGDGIMATFPSAARAVSCAVAIQRAADAFSQEHPDSAFRISVGLNAGEPVAEEADMFGAAVQLAARACAEAKGGQILTTDVVRQLVLGKGVSFADAGLAALKGFDQPVQLYEVSAAAAGIDEVAAAALRFWRRPVVWAGAAVVAALVAGGALAGVFALTGGDETTAGPEYEQFRIHVEAEFPVEISAGDCATTDIVVRGTDPEIEIAGDLAGTASLSFEARLAATDGCRTLTSMEEVSYQVAGGSLRGHTISISLQRLGDSPLVGSSTESITAGIIAGESGTYAGSVGKQTCHGTGLTRAQSGVTSALARFDCTFRLTRSIDDFPVIVHAVVDASEMATQLSSSGKPDTVRLAAAFRNNTNARLTAVTLRLPAPRDAQIATRVLASDAWVNGARTFDLPDLDPGEIATFEFTVRLLGADGDSIALAPEITAEGLDFVDHADPIELTVVR